MRISTVLLAALLSLVFAASASAATFTVDQTGDPGDGTCDASCTLRDAVDAANSNTGPDTIGFALTANAQIDLVSAITISDGALTIDGCADVSATAPCVTVHAPDTNTDAFDVQAANAHIDHLAVTGAAIGIHTNGSGTGLRVTGSWLGESTAGAAGGNQTAIALFSEGATIGGLTGPERNRIEHSTADGVILTSGNAVLEGNDFIDNATGVAFDGSAASGTTIGGTVSDAARATTACDDACNSFASGTGDAIDVDNAASNTTIAGNYVGLDRTGASAPNTGTGISVRDSLDATVGGFHLGDPNVIQGGTFGIFAEGVDTTIEGNLVGLNPAGTAKVATPSAFGIHTNEPIGHEARLFSNRVAIGGTANTSTGGIDVSGEDVVLHGNVVGVGAGGENVGGPGFGIHVAGEGGEIGGSSSDNGNTVAHAAEGGIDIAGGKNNVLENNTLTDNGRGVLVHQLNANSGSEASGNVIGGDTTATANTISDSANDAIALLPRSSSAVGNPDSGNVIGVNTGSSNGTNPAKDLFIDLADPLFGGNAQDGPGNTSAVNNGIAAPSVTSASALAIRGADAQAGATIRVFTRPTGEVGSLGAYVGSATAAADGTWAVTAGSALANGVRVVATQTGSSDGTSELSDEHAVDAVAPNTAITGGPSGSTTDTTPTFTFASSEAGSTFACKVDGGSYAPCSSPRTTAALAYGAHSFSVRATDAAGNTDASPATRSFTVAKPGTPPPPADTTPPTTRITKTPGKLTRSREPAFTFSSNEPSYIECSIDGKKYEVCGAIGPLKDGKHTLKARAVDAAGNTDATPATYVFRVDATAPKVKLGATAKRKGKTLRIKVACPKAEKDGPCRGTLTIKRKGKVVAKKGYSVKAGKTATVVLKPKHLPAKGAKLALSTSARDKLDNKKPVKKTAKVR